MMIKTGSTSRQITMYAYDIATGLPYVTAAFGDAGISLWYRRGVAGAVTAITPATQTVAGAYSSGGFILLNAADNAYRLDIPDAAFAAGVDEVEIGGHATAWKLISRTVQLVGYDPRTELTTAALANLDAAVSTRSTYAGGDTAGTTTLLSRLSSARAGYLDNLSAGAVALQSTLSTLSTTVSGLVAAVWAYATRTLTQSAASVTAAVTGSSVTVYRGTRWSIALTGLPVNTGYTAIIFSVKRRESDADSAAIFQVRTTTGLTAFAGAPTVTAGQAAITVNSSTAITITCEAATTVYATPGTYSYGVKYMDASGYPSQASDGGVFTIVGDIPKAIS